MLTTPFLKAENTTGADRLRTRQASSPSVWSRTWKTLFSIPQCARTMASSRSASAQSRGSDVTP